MGGCADGTRGARARERRRWRRERERAARARWRSLSCLLLEREGGRPAALACRRARGVRRYRPGGVGGRERFALRANAFGD